MRKSILVLGGIGLSVAASQHVRMQVKRAMGADASPTAIAAFRPRSGDVSHPRHLPAIGKWMLDPDLTPSHWLGEQYHGRPLREPINVILFDRPARSGADAGRRLLAACTAAGYPLRDGHSSGYLGYIDGRIYRQLPERPNHAFASEPFELANNHGRIFGPHPVNGGFLFVAAFSREKVEPLAHVKHAFVSFNQARDQFAEHMHRHGGYAIERFVDLRNALLHDPAASTGDHDGVAVQLVTTPWQ